MRRIQNQVKIGSPEVFCKKEFVKIPHNSQENTSALVSFLMNLQASGLQLYQKTNSSTGIFLRIL